MRCWVCGSERLSPLGRVRKSGNGGGCELWFQRKVFARRNYRAEYGRACRDCGALQLFLSESERQLLDREADELEDVTPLQ